VAVLGAGSAFVIDTLSRTSHRTPVACIRSEGRVIMTSSLVRLAQAFGHLPLALQPSVLVSTRWPYRVLRPFEQVRCLLLTALATCYCTRLRICKHFGERAVPGVMGILSVSCNRHLSPVFGHRVRCRFDRILQPRPPSLPLVAVAHVNQQGSAGIRNVGLLECEKKTFRVRKRIGQFVWGDDPVRMGRSASS